jgi:hypothetical protein
MLAIRLDVRQVIDDVDRAGKQTEDQESEQRWDRRFHIRQFLIKDEGSKQDEVFHPLVGAHGF